MEAEGIFIVTQLILAGVDPTSDDKRSLFEQIVARFPDTEERFKFYRMSVGYGLKKYCCHRATSSVSFLKAKGIEIKHVKLEEEYVPRNDHSAMMQILLDEAAVTMMEKDVLRFYLLANPIEVIGEKVGLSPKRVRKVLKRIKRRLKHADA